MIISHRLKYLFIEVPHTASTAISKELRSNYEGSSILHKHAHYHEFLKVASPEEKQYFVFAGIRNPLDEAVSLYFRYKVNHKGRYTGPKSLARYGGSVTNDDLKRFRFIRDTNADFVTYFKKFYRLPYSNVISVSYPYCSFVIHFENLQEDFAKALELIGAEQKRPLPQRNKTEEKDSNFWQYYPPEIRQQAQRVFGPFLAKWGFEFPAEWGTPSISWSNRLEFQVIDTLRNFYWKHVRWSPYFHGRLVRYLK